jgi:hypothetical protein
MKKVTLALAVLGFIFVSCKQESNLTKDEVIVDTTAVDTTAVDSAVVDTTTVDSVTNK